MLSGFDDRECRMNVGKTLFAQVMEFGPWKTFAHIIERHKGDAGVQHMVPLPNLPAIGDINPTPYPPCRSQWLRR
jgi:hypothetical protein